MEMAMEEKGTEEKEEYQQTKEKGSRKGRRRK
jgi:hypothetical protein